MPRSTPSDRCSASPEIQPRRHMLSYIRANGAPLNVGGMGVNRIGMHQCSMVQEYPQSRPDILRRASQARHQFSCIARSGVAQVRIFSLANTNVGLSKQFAFFDQARRLSGHTILSNTRSQRSVDDVIHWGFLHSPLPSLTIIAGQCETMPILVVELRMISPVVIARPSRLGPK